MAAYLIFFTTDTGTERVPCGDTIIAIGRDRNNNVVLNDLSVSRNHAIVRCLGNGDFYLIDSGSSNGSWINQRRITSPTLLSNGDRIGIGKTEFIFEQEPEVGSPVDSRSFEATMVVHRPLIKEITILVADMRGFTSMSEQLPIQVLTKIMNHWFNSVSEIIAEDRGAIDKFIGDCVFARWESNNASGNVVDALHAACRINATTMDLSYGFPELRHPPRIGAGIHTGTASLDIGNESTALGDSVNTAFRLEAATKEIGADVVLSAGAWSHLDDEFCHVEWKKLKLKGKARPVKVTWLDFDRAMELVTWMRTGTKS